MIFRQVNIKRQNEWFILALSINFDMIWECIWCMYMHYAHVHRELLNLHWISSCIRLWSCLSFGGKSCAWPSQRWSSNTYDGGEWEDSIPAMSDFGLLRFWFVEDSVLMVGVSYSKSIQENSTLESVHLSTAKFYDLLHSFFQIGPGESWFGPGSQAKRIWKSWWRRRFCLRYFNFRCPSPPIG